MSARNLDQVDAMLDGKTNANPAFSYLKIGTTFGAGKAVFYDAAGVPTLTPTAGGSSRVDLSDTIASFDGNVAIAGKVNYFIFGVSKFAVLIFANNRSTTPQFTQIDLKQSGAVVTSIAGGISVTLPSAVSHIGGPYVDGADVTVSTPIPTLLEEIRNVSNTTAGDGQHLVYNNTLGKWEPQSLALRPYVVSGITGGDKIINLGGVGVDVFPTDADFLYNVTDGNGFFNTAPSATNLGYRLVYTGTVTKNFAVNVRLSGYADVNDRYIDFKLSRQGVPLNETTTRHFSKNTINNNESTSSFTHIISLSQNEGVDVAFALGEALPSPATLFTIVSLYINIWEV